MDQYHEAMLFLAAVAASCIAALRRRGWARRRVVRLGRGVGWGTVYVFRDRARPRLVKVGTTRRLSKVRKGEVSRTMADGGALVQVYAVDMPYAKAVETAAHRLLRAHRAKVGRGREWFRAAEDEGVGHVVEAIRKAAAEVRDVALRRGRWPAGMDAKAREVVSSGGRLAKASLFAGAE